MRVGLIAPPFIAVPPADYGGTELFVAHLAEGLKQTRAVEPVVYANGESTVSVECRSLYDRSQWPIKEAETALLRELNHTSWAVCDAMRDCDVIHVQSAPAIAYSRFSRRPFVLTLHGPHEDRLSQFYSYYPDVDYVAISQAQARQESLPRLRTIHHGIDVSLYKFVDRKQSYLSFIGRIAPIKGTHIAIEVALRTGIPLKIAGEVQPVFREYFENKIRPRIDGKNVEYVGVADLAAKNELLGNSMAMLFPIQWHEPFGLAMVEAMACGTPVLAMSGGSVPEIVRDGISGHVCRSVRDMVKRVQSLSIPPATVRGYVEQNFSMKKMVDQYADLYAQLVQEKLRQTA